MSTAQMLAIAGAFVAIAAFFLRHEVNRVLVKVESIPDPETWKEWRKKMELFDPVRLEAHFKAGHDMATMIGKHELRLDQHDKRITLLEEYGRREHWGPPK